MLFGPFEKQLDVPAVPWSRSSLTRAVALLSLGIWIFLAAAEVCPSLHSWLHGGVIPENDGCAITLASQGKLETVASSPQVVIPILGMEIAPHVEFLVFRPVTIFFAGDRGPPVSSLNS